VTRDPPFLGILAAVVALSSFLWAAFLNELGELSPWLAERLVRRAVRTMAPADSRDWLEEELLANVEAKPGKLLKLATAIGIALWMPAIGRTAGGPPPWWVALIRRATRWTGTVGRRTARWRLPAVGPPGGRQGSATPGLPRPLAVAAFALVGTVALGLLLPRSQPSPPPPPPQAQAGAPGEAACPEGARRIASHTSIEPVPDGSEVGVDFALDGGCEDVEVSLVSYQLHAPAGSGGAEQVVYDIATATVPGGRVNHLQVAVEPCWSMVRLVVGRPPDELDPPNIDAWTLRDTVHTRLSGGRPSCDGGAAARVLEPWSPGAPVIS
jgi:hypothetical protein